MTDSYLQLRKISFSGPKKRTDVVLMPGVNVICGASDTGKSFLAESIDFMLGGSTLKEIPERAGYGEAALEFATSLGENWLLQRATSGGDFKLTDLNVKSVEPTILKQNHAHDRTDNVSGFLLEKIGLLGKRILKSSAKGTTQSLSFRNLARLVIVQEGEIQQSGSPFWGGQFTLKTAELATVKLLLTGVDDSNIVAAGAASEPDNSRQIALIDELIVDLISDIADAGGEQSELSDQLERLEASIETQREGLAAVQEELNARLASRRNLLLERNAIETRTEEIKELLARFDLLREHYEVDTKRLAAIQESGSMFIHVQQVPCPLCGASPDAQHLDDSCDGDVEAIVQAASAEIAKVQKLNSELLDTVSELREEHEELSSQIAEKLQEYEALDAEIRETVSPQVGDARATFSSLVEERARVQKSLNLYDRLSKLEQRKQVLLEIDEEPEEKQQVAAGIPDAVSHALSLKIETILRAWNFPGECHVHFDKATSDFVIDGKPRGSRGKGLRAITHAAVTLGLLEYCQEHSLPHPGFVVLDSPLLAYFKPEGDEDRALQGTDLKERFYTYLIQHHGNDSQVVIIENQHPPEALEKNLTMTVFTRNPSDGRFGFL
jgi:predicted nuclease with TOPRIM domain